MFNSKLRNESVEQYNQAVERYEAIAKKFENSNQKLYNIRKNTIYLINEVQQHINSLANTPKEFKVRLNKIESETLKYENKMNDIEKAIHEAKAAAGGSGTTATLSAMGIAVATMGPTAAMGVASTFGVASTGTAISALSGAAATNASLAWLGGGTLAAGGGGISAGTALLALSGPVGWTIAASAGSFALYSGIKASTKNKKMAEELAKERENIERLARKYAKLTSEIVSLFEITKEQKLGVEEENLSLTGNDYSKFTEKEKIQAGILVNHTLALAQLVNKELKLHE